MATGTAGSTSLPPAAASASAPRTADRERYIESQLRKTRRAVRGVELTSRLMLFVAASVAFFLFAAFVDHWIAAGGLGVYGRLAFLVVFLVGAGLFAARYVVPLLIYRINPVFAAHTIERAKPGLKNTLVNFLFLRSSRAAVPDVVLNAVEEQAATNLSHTPIEHVVDRTRLVHIGYLLLAMVAAFALYYLASPKSPLQTVGRVILPWADLQPPSRVMLEDIQPGTTTVFRGQRVTVSAQVLGLGEGEQVTLYYTTSDRQSVDQPVRMYVQKDADGRHSVSLPPETASRPANSAAGDGLQQDVEYRIEAGDATSKPYRLSVVHAPNIVVEKVDYTYPEYTRLQAESVTKSGDVKAVEGTHVTIHALANQPIKSAYVDFGGDGQKKQPMKVNGLRATTTFTLALNEQRDSPLYNNYFVRFRSDGGHENPDPIRYRIEVTPDPAPDLQLLRPEKVEMTVPLNVPVQFELEASDPLYGLADVRIVANVRGKTAFRRNWSIARNDKSAERFVHRHSEPLGRITLDAGAKLKAGDVIEYWAEAVDNKLPTPNVIKTDVRKLVIAEPQKRQDQQQPQPNNGEGQQGEGQQGEGQQGRDEQQPQDQANQKNQQPNEGDRNNQRNEKGQPPQDGKQKQPQDSKNQERQDQNRDPNSAKDDQRDEKGGAGQEKQQPMKGEGGAGSQKNQGETGKSDPNEKSNSDAQRNEGPAGANNQDKQSESNRQPSQADEQRPVDKSDDGAAIDRILKHAQEKGGKSPEQGQEVQPEGSNNTKEQPSDDQQEKKRDDGSDTQQSEKKQDDGAAKKSGSGKQPQQGPEKTGGEKKQPGDAQQKNSGDKAGEAQPNQRKNDESSAGKSGGTTPSPQEKMKPKGKEQPGDSPAEAQKEQQEKSPAHGKNDSNTKGQDSGDRSGDGKAGGGKNDNRAGKGASGAHEAANDGGSAAKEPGKGQDGTDAGDEKSADGNTGKSGTEKGDGSKSKTGTAGGEKTEKTDDSRKSGEPQPADAKDGVPKTTDQKQPDAKGSKNGDAQPQDAKQKSEQPSKQPGKENGEGQGKNGKPDARSKQTSPDGKGRPATGGGGTPEGDPAEPPDQARVDPTDDKANLEYAKRATDLALDHLRNQLKDGEPDQDLLDRLGWSKDDLQKLLTRWEKLEREAKQPGPQNLTAQEKLKEAISSLGLKRPTRVKRDAGRADDTARGLRDAARTTPPPEYADDYEAFKRSTSRAK